jgi:hypothetical protein
MPGSTAEDHVMTEDVFRAVLLQALEALGVAGEVVPQRLVAAEGRWSAALDVRAKAGTVVQIAVSDADDPGRVGRDVRSELRRALRMCPLCQRIGHVEKLRDAEGQQEACAVRCPACGEFEIDQALIRDLRAAWERGDRSVLDRLAAVSEVTRRGPGATPRLTNENWRSVR